MKVLTAYSHKGGTGKTTTLLMLANAIAAKGRRALLIDCDPHQSFAAFRSHSMTGNRGLWYDGFDIEYLNYEKTSLERLETVLLAADDAGQYDYALLNLAGTDHRFNRHALRYAELTLLPFAPSALDLMELPDALSVIQSLGDDGEIGIARVVLTKMRARMNAAQSAYIDAALDGFPMMSSQIRDTAINGDLVMRGILSKTITRLNAEAIGLQRGEIKRYRETLAECVALLDEVEATIVAAEHRG